MHSQSQSQWHSHTDEHVSRKVRQASFLFLAPPPPLSHFNYPVWLYLLLRLLSPLLHCWHSVVIAEHAKFCAILCRFNSFLLADFLVSYLSHISLLAWHFISLRFEIYAYAYTHSYPLLESWITNSRSCNCSVKIVQSVGFDFNWFRKARLAWPTNFPSIAAENFVAFANAAKKLPPLDLSAITIDWHVNWQTDRRTVR